MEATFVHAPVPPDAASPERRVAVAEVQALLTQAAQKAVQLGLDPDAFMAGAQAAYLNANPELRERLESAQLMAQLDELRRRGMLGQA
jgi:hypothetical protein